jgi:uncharacterized membrane protein YphA (DoxX/SURF4 family)
MFSTFPDGLSGVGLLILRSALGVALALRTFACLHDRNAENPVIVMVILLMAPSALLIITGYRTRGAAVAAMLALSAAMVCCAGAPVLEELDMRTTEVFGIVIAAAVACVGPGMFSLDSRLFGRREIVIPKSSHRN